MKKIFFLLSILIICLAAWGSVVVVYASEAHPVVLHVTPTVQPKATPKVIVDKPATPASDVVDDVVFQGSANKPEIALTFDDGPNPAATGQVLSILQQYKIHATFFCIGENVQNYPGLVAQEMDQGNVVGNHTWDHPDLTTATVSQIQSELTSTNHIIQEQTGVAPTLVRPPYGAINGTVKEQIAQLHETPILWSIDTEDWSLPGTPAIVSAVLDHAGNGDIVLMHDGGGVRTQTIAALPQIIQGLQQRGFTLVTVPQLLQDMQ